jgi:hypothetical protein
MIITEGTVATPEMPLMTEKNIYQRLTPRARRFAGSLHL